MFKGVNSDTFWSCIFGLNGLWNNHCTISHYRALWGTRMCNKRASNRTQLGTRAPCLPNWYQLAHLQWRRGQPSNLAIEKKPVLRESEARPPGRQAGRPVGWDGGGETHFLSLWVSDHPIRRPFLRGKCNTRSGRHRPFHPSRNAIETTEQDHTRSRHAKNNTC